MWWSSYRPLPTTINKPHVAATTNQNRCCAPAGLQQDSQPIGPFMARPHMSCCQPTNVFYVFADSCLEVSSFAGAPKSRACRREARRWRDRRDASGRRRITSGCCKDRRRKGRSRDRMLRARYGRSTGYRGYGHCGHAYGQPRGLRDYRATLQPRFHRLLRAPTGIYEDATGATGIYGHTGPDYLSPEGPLPTVIWSLGGSSRTACRLIA